MYMKKRIKGVTYNTETSREIEEKALKAGETFLAFEKLYQRKNGDYFIVYESITGFWKECYVVSCEDILPLSTEDYKEWIAKPQILDISDNRDFILDLHNVRWRMKRENDLI